MGTLLWEQCYGNDAMETFQLLEDTSASKESKFSPGTSTPNTLQADSHVHRSASGDHNLDLLVEKINDRDCPESFSDIRTERDVLS